MLMRPGQYLCVMMLGGCYLSTAMFDEESQENPGVRDVTDETRDNDSTVNDDERVEIDAPPTPRRVLFMVDVSQSMATIDPPDLLTGETRRTRGLRQAIEALLTDDRYETAISIMRFWAISTIITYADENGNGAFDDGESYFVRSNETLLGRDGSGGVLELLRDSGLSSNYRDTLVVAQGVVQDELAYVEAGDIADMELLVIVVGDFGLETSRDEIVIEEAIIEEARRLASIGATANVDLFEIHCAHMTTGAEGLDRPASAFAGHIADAGMGTVRSFDRGEELDLLFMEP